MFNNNPRVPCYVYTPLYFYPNNSNINYLNFMASPYNQTIYSAIKNPNLNTRQMKKIYDYGSKPYVVDIEEVTKENMAFRTAIWTGKHLQITLMSINVGEDIGLENHPELDQFLRIEEGEGIVKMGDYKDNLNFSTTVKDDYAIVIPAGKWHNLINTGNIPLKLYSIYAPPQHPFGTVHETKEIAIASEKHTHHN